MKNVLLIGMGYRMKTVIVPALWCLRDRYRIVGAVTRSSGSVTLCDGKLTIPTMHDFDSVDFKTIDRIVLAVSTSDVPRVLKRLSKYDTRHSILFLDTPVFHPQHLTALRYTKRFKSVYVSEDCIALPPFVAARRIIDEGKIGEVTHIYFFHNGYKYHGLASLKMLADTRSLVSVRSRKMGKQNMTKEILFGNGVRATMFEPRNYDNCKFLIVGKKGCIADYAEGLPHAAKGNTYTLSYDTDEGVYTGVRVNGVLETKNQLDELYLKNIPHDIEERCLMNSFKIRGFMDLMEGAEIPNSPYRYDIENGYIDNTTIIFAEKLGYVHRLFFPLVLAYRIVAGVLRLV